MLKWPPMANTNVILHKVKRDEYPIRTVAQSFGSAEGRRACVRSIIISDHKLPRSTWTLPNETYSQLREIGAIIH